MAVSFRSAVAVETAEDLWHSVAARRFGERDFKAKARRKTHEIAVLLERALGTSSDHMAPASVFMKHRSRHLDHRHHEDNATVGLPKWNAHAS